MKNFNKISLLFFTLLFALSISVSNAQDTEKPVKKTSSFDKHFFINGNAGFTDFFGDLHPSKDLGTAEMFGWGLKAGYQFSPIFGTRLSFVNGKLLSTSAYKVTVVNDAGIQYDTDLLRYKGSFSDITAQLTVDFTNIFRDNYDAKFSFYGFGGLGVMLNKGNVYDLRNDLIYNNPNNSLSYGDYKNTNLVFPVGLGLKYGITEALEVSAESSMRFSTSDLIEQTEGGAMMFKKDRYMYTSLGITYKINAGAGVNKMIKNHDQVIYKVTPEVLQEKGDKVPYTVSVTFPENYFSPKAAVQVAPVLKYGNQELALTPQTFVGEKVVGQEGQLVPYKTGGTYTFKGVFDFVPEMAASTVEINPVVYVPKANTEPEYKNLAASQFKIADGIIHTEDLAGGNEETLLADNGYELETIVSKQANLYFPKNLYNYSKTFGLNKDANMVALRDSLNKFIAKGWAIKNVTVNAYASPEGEETFNANLSANRAKVGDKYLHTEMQKLIKAKDSKIAIKDLSAVNFSAVGNGPDWDGFMSALESSSIKEKSTILNVVKSAAPAQKEVEIRNMILIYPELEKILSPLRRAELTVNSFLPKRSAEEIANLATTSPEQLSKEELLYAATLTEDQAAKTAIYKSAANLFPNSWEAQANYAYAEIINGNFSNALTYLEKANTLSPNNALILNNMGVVYAKQGDWTKAKQNFTSAQGLGASENYNLGVAAIQFGEYDKALSLFGSKKCDVNVGLAQLLLEKYDDAKANLNCAEQTCKVNYLLAIIAARTSNDAEVFANLKKAFDMNPKLKGKAMNDREFIRYFDNAEFLSLVK